MSVCLYVSMSLCLYVCMSVYLYVFQEDYSQYVWVSVCLYKSELLEFGHRNERLNEYFNISSRETVFIA